MPCKLPLVAAFASGSTTSSQESSDGCGASPLAWQLSRYRPSECWFCLLQCGPFLKEGLVRHQGARRVHCPQRGQDAGHAHSRHEGGGLKTPTAACSCTVLVHVSPVLCRLLLLTHSEEANFCHRSDDAVCGRTDCLGWPEGPRVRVQPGRPPERECAAVWTAVPIIVPRADRFSCISDTYAAFTSLLTLGERAAE
jgi:hypothetical protein